MHGDFDTFPYDMKTFLHAESLHRSIQNQEPLDFCNAMVLVFPRSVFEWFSGNSFKEIVRQYVRFFATWHLEDPENETLAFDQSPKILHRAIREDTDFLKSKFAEASRVDVAHDEIQMMFDHYVSKMPPWLDVRKSGNVEGVSKCFTFLVDGFFLRDDDIERCNRDTLEDRSEADWEAFEFWKHCNKKIRWHVIPGLSPVENKIGADNGSP